MKLIKLGLISFIVLGIIVTLIGLLFPATVLVSRAVDVKASKASIKRSVADIQNWPTWVQGMDDSTVSIQSSVKAILGNTQVEITAITDTTIVSTWTSLKGQQQLSTIRIIGDSTHNYAVVQWQFVQKISWYPWERFSSMMNDEIMGTMMEQNLQLLKNSLEK